MTARVGHIDMSPNMLENLEARKRKVQADKSQQVRAAVKEEIVTGTASCGYVAARLLGYHHLSAKMLVRSIEDELKQEREVTWTLKNSKASASRICGLSSRRPLKSGMRRGSSRSV